MQFLAERTEGMSGSGLKELCRNAAMSPVREAIRRVDGDVESLARDQEQVRLPFLRLDLLSDTLYLSGPRTPSSYD
jgi:SpoVK/Ycf46/Vps4 family AAA+-type ATPase